MLDLGLFGAIIIVKTFFRFPMVCYSQHISEDELLQILCVSAKEFYMGQVYIN